MTTTIEVRERPILFSGEMVKAILEGRKTMTRRPVKPQPHEWQNGDLIYKDRLIGSSWPERAWGAKINGTNELMEYEEACDVCPFGKPGDRLWVREAWATSNKWDDTAPSQLPTDCSLWWTNPAAPASHRVLGHRPGKSRPSIHMPRWASRITLEVTGVRVERLHDISEQDAIAEGVGDTTGYVNAIDKFDELWHYLDDSPYSQPRNPWVWVIEFKRVEV